METRKKRKWISFLLLVLGIGIILFLTRHTWQYYIWPKAEEVVLEEQNFSFDDISGKYFIYTPTNVSGTAPTNRGFYYGTNFGVSFHGVDGKSKMTHMYSMTHPMHQGEGDFLAVADEEGKDFYVFKTEGVLFQKQTKEPIVCFGINEQGYSVLVTSDGNAYYIHVYDAEGEERSEGVIGHEEQFVVAADISDDGRIFAIGTIDISSLTVKSEITFVYVKEEDSFNVKDGIFGAISLAQDEVLGQVQFMENNQTLILSDSHVRMIDTNETVEEIWNMKVANQIVRFSSLDKSSFALAYGEVFLNEREDKFGHVDVFTLANELVFEHVGYSEITSLEYSQHQLVIGSGTNFTAYHPEGRMLWHYVANFEDSSIYPIGSQYLLLTEPKKLHMLKVNAFSKKGTQKGT